MGGVILSYGRVKDLGADVAAWREGGRQTIFLTPSSEDRELLRGLLAGEKGFFGELPPVWRWNDLYRELGKAVRVAIKGQLDPPDHALVVAHVVRTLIKEADEKGWALPPGVRRGGFKALLGRHLRELLREGVEPEDLTRGLKCPGCSDAPCGNLGHPGGILCRLFRDYTDWLAAHDLADSAAVPSLAADLLEEELPKKWARERRFVLVGFLSFTSAQLRLVRALGSVAEVVLAKPDPGIEGFYDGAEQLEAWSREKRGDPGGKWHLLEAGTPSLEPEVAVREIALWAAGRSALASRLSWPGFGGVGVVAPREALPLLEEALGRYRVPWSFRGRVSAAETFLGTLPRQIWRAAQGGWGLGETALALAHPLLGGDALRERAGKERPSGEEAWRAFDDRGADKTFKKVADFARMLKEGAPPRTLLEALETLISQGNEGLRRASALADSPLWGPEGPRHGELDGAVRRLAGALEELRRKIRSLEEREKLLEEAGKAFFQGVDALDFLEEWAEEATVAAAPPLGGAVALYADTPPVLATHPVLFFLGLTASRWPGTGADSPLLGDDLRREVNAGERDGAPALHLLLRHERRQQKEALFRRIVAVGEQLTVLSRPQQDSEGRPTAPSPFVESFTRNSKDAAGENTLVRSAAETLPDAEEPFFPAREALRRGKIAFRGNFPRTASWEPRNRGNFSDLDLFTACPFAYSMARLRKLEEKSWEEEGGGEPLREGTFLHRLWELVWQTPGAGEEGTSLEELVDRYWDQALKPEEGASSGHPYEGYRALREDPRCAPRARFLRFAARRLGRLQDQAEESRRRDGVEVTHRLRESVNPRMVVGGVTFSGRCDRVDLTSQGALLLDYKLGNVAGKKIRRLQLAAYALALEEGRLSGENPLPGGQEIRGFAYLGHRDGKAQGEMEPPFYRWYGMKSSGSLDVAMAEAREALESMAGALQEGKYPANYASENCAWCPYPALCRRGESQGEGMGEDQGDEDEIQEGA